MKKNAPVPTEVSIAGTFSDLLESSYDRLNSNDRKAVDEFTQRTLSPILETCMDDERAVTAFRDTLAATHKGVELARAGSIEDVPAVKEKNEMVMRLRQAAQASGNVEGTSREIREAEYAALEAARPYQACITRSLKAAAQCAETFEARHMAMSKLPRDAQKAIL